MDVFENIDPGKFVAPTDVFLNLDTGKVEEDSFSNRHGFRFAFSVVDLVDVQPYTFKQNITTNCQTWPTTWSLEFMFEQKPDTSIASCTITAKRTDSLDRTVKARIETCHTYKEYQSHQMERLYTEEFRPGQEVQIHCPDILPFPEESQKYLDGGILVEVVLSVCCCDQE